MDHHRFLITALPYAHKNDALLATPLKRIDNLYPKRKTMFKNWRPISLLTSHEASIVNRIKHVLTLFIHEVQKGVLAGRCVGEVTRKI